MKTLTDLFKSELKDMYDAEHRIAKALPKMVKAATCEQLKAIFKSHLEETTGQIKKLDQVFKCFGWEPKAVTCKATVGLLEEADALAAEFKGSLANNAALIAAAQKIEHYEIASYGCLHAWALLLKNERAAKLILEILEEEKAADHALTELSHEKNQEAMGEQYSRGVGSRTDAN
jgi:ferritin-like metal-binding protein YciE